VTKNKIATIMAAEKRRERELGTEMSRMYRVEGDRYLQMISSNCMKENM
jgi:hypothetical protein